LIFYRETSHLIMLLILIFRDLFSTSFFLGKVVSTFLLLMNYDELLRQMCRL